MRPKARAFIAAFGAIALAAAMPASDPIGGYALLDRVVIENNPTGPATVQLWGVFILNTVVGKRIIRRDGTDEGVLAHRGYVYYTLNDNVQATRAEWADLQSVAGTRQVVGFGSARVNMGRVRPPSEPPATPDVYPPSWGGVIRVEATHGNSTAFLLTVPTAMSPADGARVRAGAVELAARRPVDVDQRLQFEIIAPDSTHEWSAAMVAADSIVRWTPGMRVQAGKRYTWRVYAIPPDGAMKRAVAANFTVESVR